MAPATRGPAGSPEDRIQTRRAPTHLKKWCGSFWCTDVRPTKKASAKLALLSQLCWYARYVAARKPVPLQAFDEGGHIGFLAYDDPHFLIALRQVRCIEKRFTLAKCSDGFAVPE